MSVSGVATSSGVNFAGQGIPNQGSRTSKKGVEIIGGSVKQGGIIEHNGVV